MSENNKEDQVYKIFLNSIEQMKFSEAKNAMLIAFDAASIYGLAQLYGNDYIKGSRFLTIYFLLSILIIGIAIVFLLVSFLPILRKKTSCAESSAFPNILFFGFLKDKKKTDILNEIYGNTTGITYTNFETDLVEQIIQYSIITHRKYRLFHIAVWITIVAYLMNILVIGIYFL